MCTANFPTTVDLICSYPSFSLLLSVFSSFLSSINIYCRHKALLSVAVKNYSCCLRTLISSILNIQLPFNSKNFPETQFLTITQDLPNSSILYFHFINLSYIIIHYTSLPCFHVYLRAPFPCDIKSNGYYFLPSRNISFFLSSTEMCIGLASHPWSINRALLSIPGLRRTREH